jgi:NAD(P)-dependent dehydrogenase (short-subunit alcohol dehydrogenase family)
MGEVRLLEGRHALVTGAAGGIGSAVVQAFRAHGATTCGADLAGLSGKPASGDAMDIVFVDVTDEASVEAAFVTASAAHRLTDVVHAAGAVSVGPLAELSVAELRRVLEVNLVGSFLVARAASRLLAGGSTITLVSSQAGLRGGALWSAYSAAKAGVLRLAESLAEELGPTGIRVNTVCPGSVQTPMIDQAIDRLAELLGTSPEVLRKDYLSRIPFGRFAEPAEVANACVLLASPLASYVSGTALIVDGAELSG